MQLRKRAKVVTRAKENRKEKAVETGSTRGIGLASGQKEEKEKENPQRVKASRKESPKARANSRKERVRQRGSSARIGAGYAESGDTGEMSVLSER